MTAVPVLPTEMELLKNVGVVIGVLGPSFYLDLMLIFEDILDVATTQTAKYLWQIRQNLVDKVQFWLV